MKNLSNLQRFICVTPVIYNMLRKEFCWQSINLRNGSRNVRPQTKPISPQGALIRSNPGEKEFYIIQVVKLSNVIPELMTFESGNNTWVYLS